MTRKNRTGRKKRNRRQRAKRRLGNLELSLFKTISKLAFLLVFLAFIYIGLTSSITLIVALAGVAIFLWAAVVLPTDEFKDVGRYLWDGSFGEDLHNLWRRLIPGRGKGRGQVTTRAVYAVACVTVAATLVLTPALAGVAAGQSGDESGFQTTHDCSTAIHYTEFRTDDAVVQSVNETGVGEVTKKNTRVRLVEPEAFYRVRATNPNTYCVEMTVEISQELMPLADLGEVESINGVTTARWTNVYSFENQSGYTELTFTVPANATVTFAPSKPTVFLPAWRDERAREAQGILDRVKSLNPFSSEDEPLKKRVYHFYGNQSNSVTVRLDNPNSDERIKDWHAVYRLDKSNTWKPVDTDTTDPVYYRKPGENRVEFVMQNEKATVEFTANPTMKDDIVHDIRSYTRSWEDILQLIPGATTPTSSGVVGW